MLRVDGYQPNVVILDLTYYSEEVKFCFKIIGHAITTLNLYDYVKQFI